MDKLPEAVGPPSPSLDLIIRGSKKRNSMKKEKLGHRRVNATGTVTYKKKSTDEIRLAIQIGINTSVGSIQQKPSYDLLERDFNIIERSDFPKDGSKCTPAHSFSDFRFVTYAPEAFRAFRNLFNLNMLDFLNSICSKDLVELSNPGASGSIFYMTCDDEFIIKTVQKKEAEFLHRILVYYYINLRQNPRTLLPKYYGLYTYQSGSKNIRFVVMNNLLPSLTIHEKYDLKGSTYKRKASEKELAKKSPTLKDLDFAEKHPNGILLEAETYDAFMHTIARDCRFLESLSIMDYSLLLGVHNLDLAKRERLKQANYNSGGDNNDGVNTENITENPSSTSPKKEVDDIRPRPRPHSKRIVTMGTVMENILPEAQPVILEEEEQEVIAPGGIPARNNNGDRLLLYVGIIDILQSYRLIKKMEHSFKAIVIDPETFSVTNPKFYAQRFMNNLKKNVFRKAASLDDVKSVGPYKYRFRKIVLEAMRNAPKKRPTSTARRSNTGRQQDKDDSEPMKHLSANVDYDSSNLSVPQHYLDHNNKINMPNSRSCHDSPLLSSALRNKKISLDKHFSYYDQNPDFFPTPYRHQPSYESGLNRNYKFTVRDLSNPNIPQLMRNYPDMSKSSHLLADKNYFQNRYLGSNTLSNLFTPSQADSNNLEFMTDSSTSISSNDSDTNHLSNRNNVGSLLADQENIYNSLISHDDITPKGLPRASFKNRLCSSASSDSDVDNQPIENRIISIRLPSQTSFSSPNSMPKHINQHYDKYIDKKINTDSSKTPNKTNHVHEAEGNAKDEGELLNENFNMTRL